MQPLSKGKRTLVRPLYEGFPSVHAAVESTLEGYQGEVYVDDPKRPTVARLLVGDFHLIAGIPIRP
ncbi:MAG: hypothetical protein ABI559_02235, partial [Chloroflexota bacterium]